MLEDKVQSAFDIATIVAPQTRKLEIREMKVANVANIAKSFPKLESLTLQKCEGITNYDFLKELPDLEVEELNANNQSKILELLKIK